MRTRGTGSASTSRSVPRAGSGSDAHPCQAVEKPLRFGGALQQLWRAPTIDCFCLRLVVAARALGPGLTTSQPPPDSAFRCEMLQRHPTPPTSLEVGAGSTISLSAPDAERASRRRSDGAQPPGTEVFTPALPRYVAEGGSTRFKLARGQRTRPRTRSASPGRGHL